jgi:hypothetical protein
MEERRDNNNKTKNKTQRSSTVCARASSMDRLQEFGHKYIEYLFCEVSLTGSPYVNTRAVCKVRGLTLLLQVGTLWRRGDGLFFEVPPLASDALLTTLLENVLQTVDRFEISCLVAPFSWLKTPRNRTGRDLNCMADVFPSRTQNSIEISPPRNFWAFPTMKRELRGKKFRSDQRSATRFREVGGAL